MAFNISSEFSTLFFRITHILYRRTTARESPDLCLCLGNAFFYLRSVICSGLNAFEKLA